MELALTADEHRQWVDWANPLTGGSMGRPRLPDEDRRGSPRFAEQERRNLRRQLLGDRAPSLDHGLGR